ncbi:spike base protein, RCAP_Rcc01079 family [Alloyangia pacifica]|uniref:Uncharacterized protein n=1 Tax=Alloyangia pacifica TaxID=311180 RepID=A0A1I6T3P2_9RHOB|nr:hypothetical protein [Alloyangia pacifica]SDG96693.1 hypothetical protein SAMN04488245_105278 [Alloyangia pacifica]SFS83889.1 hypothetical protein SAMN04488050_105278 [Alloyangia pacifica]
MTDHFAEHQSGLSSPATELHDVTPDDGADLPVFARGLSVTQSGTMTVTTVGGTVATIYVAAGSVFPVRVRRVWQTGTSATGIVGLV